MPSQPFQPSQLYRRSIRRGRDLETGTGAADFAGVVAVYEGGDVGGGGGEEVGGAEGCCGGEGAGEGEEEGVLGAGVGGGGGGRG